MSEWACCAHSLMKNQGFLGILCKVAHRVAKDLAKITGYFMRGTKDGWEYEASLQPLGQFGLVG